MCPIILMFSYPLGELLTWNKCHMVFPPPLWSLCRVFSQHFNASGRQSAISSWTVFSIRWKKLRIAAHLPKITDQLNQRPGVVANSKKDSVGFLAKGNKSAKASCGNVSPRWMAQYSARKWIWRMPVTRFHPGMKRPKGSKGAGLPAPSINWFTFWYRNHWFR